jgi:arylsulfatase A-like enzyme
MSRVHASAHLAALVFGCLLGGCARPEAPLTPKVLVIGIDGVRPDVLAEVDTPHLDALAADGLYSDQARTGSPTVSGPGWSSFLIGVTPDKHGVVSNDFTGNAYERYPDFLTRLERVDPAFSTLAVVDWRPLGDTVDGGPVISAAVDSLVLLDGYEVGWLAADYFAGDIAASLLATSDVDAAFVYLGAPDEVSHETGSIGEEYRSAIAASDGIVGTLIGAVQARPTFAEEDWLVIVSSDHGRRDDGGHGGESPEEKTIPFLVSGTAVTRAFTDTPAIADVAVTALVHLGLELDAAWGLDGRPMGIMPPP